jgi:hypothetical protein
VSKEETIVAAAVAPVDVVIKPKRGRPSKKQKEEDKETKMDIEKQQELE